MFFYNSLHLHTLLIMTYISHYMPSSLGSTRIPFPWALYLSTSRFFYHPLLPHPRHVTSRRAGDSFLNHIVKCYKEMH